ncbi:MAG: DUF3572 domain-containing protein [Paracoccaceae bacterium]
MKQENAETIALHALGWLVAHEDLLPVFLGATGAGLDDVRARASDPDFLGAVLDFLAMDDAWVVAFCDAHGLAYDDPMRARHALPGGAQMHWT